MVAELEPGESAGVEIVHDLLARLDVFFDVKEVGEEE